MRTRIKVMLVILVPLLISFKALTEGSSAAPSRQSQLMSLQTRLDPGGYKLMNLTDSTWSPEMTVFREPCIYYISAVSAEGGTEEYYQTSVKQGQSVVFVYDGQIYINKQPRWLPIVAQNVYKLLRAAKFKTEFPSVFAVRFDNICRLDQAFTSATLTSLHSWQSKE